MGNIVLLDDLTINQIAAGEVIERPMNVVKELVENSIDAGATKVVVTIKDGGKTLIQVTDNGSGIDINNMDIALERHATSKISKIEDLENTYSFGFRGEALASISSISELTMISKTADEMVGYKLFSRGGNILEKDEIGASTGTTIKVEKLFYNTPVRYKFLKNDATEFRYIKEFLQKVALAEPDKSIELINNGKQILKTSGNGEIKDVVYLLYGKEIKDNLVDVNYQDGDIKITGVVGNTFIAEENRKNQILFLNNRNIQDKILTNSADQAFKGSTGIGKYGFFILNLQMPADYYDVNVHPTKKEVRFRDEDKIYKAMYHAIKNAILSKDFLGNTETENNKEDYIENELEFVTNHFDMKENSFLSGLEKAQVKKKTAIEMNLSDDVQQEEKVDEKQESKSDAEMEIEAKEELEAPKESLITREEKRKINYKYIGIAFKTYIIVEIENEIYLIDQHAAHERVLYEQIKENYKNHIQNNVQMMLIPEVFTLSYKEARFVKENMELFKNTGFDIEFFGDNTIKINGIPDLEYKVDRGHVFLDVLDEMLTNERSSLKDIEERFVATVACKAAVKAGMDLSRQEVENLISSLLGLKNPYTCPHGRPTTIKIDIHWKLNKIVYNIHNVD